MKREDIYLILIFILLGVVSFYFGYNYKSVNTNAKQYVQENLYSENTNCYGFDLFESSYCINQQFKDFFHYNNSQIGKEINLTELKTDGGVCSHASKYYKDSAEELGFYGTTCIMKVYENNTTIHQHEIAIISNKEGYVVLDQKEIVGEARFKINTSEVKDE